MSFGEIRNILKLVLCGFLLLAMSGCSISTKSMQQNDTKEKSVIYISPNEYKKTVEDLLITPAYNPNPYLFSNTKDYLYFGETERNVIGNEILYSFDIYKTSLSTEKNTILLISGKERILSFSATNCNDEDIISLVTLGEGACFLREYDSEGVIKEEIRIDDKTFCESYVRQHWRLKDGSYYAMSEKKVFHISILGTCKCVVSCPEYEFMCGTVMADDSLYLTYRGNKADAFKIASITKNKEQLEQEISIQTEISSMTPYDEKSIFFVQTDGIYLFDTSDNTIALVLDFSEFSGISNARLRAVCGGSTGLQLISWKGGYRIRPVELFSFQKMDDFEKQERKENMENGKTDSFGRKRIKIMDVSERNGMGLKEAILNFNTDNNEFYAELLESYSDPNVVLSGTDEIDVIILEDMMECQKFYEHNLLENILPYIQNSNYLGEEHFHDFVWEAYGNGDGLYVIPRKGRILALLAQGDQITEYSGWNTDDFLRWLENRDEIGIGLVSHDNILRTCLMCNIDNYVNYESSVGYFDQKEFYDLMDRIKKIDLKKFKRLNELAPQNEKYLLTTLKINMVMDLSSMEASVGTQLVNMGYPNDDGVARVIIEPVENMCIMKSSKVKDGAFSFMEYLLYYPAEGLLGEEEPIGKGGEIWSLKELFEADTDASKGKISFVGQLSNLQGNDEGSSGMTAFSLEINDSHVNCLKEMMQCTKVDTLRNKIIRDIVLEESVAYFSDQKSLEETCKIIQNRVQLYLDENR